MDKVAVVIPALNEEANLRRLLPDVRDQGVGQIIVGDNGSSDGTATVARQHGATVGFAQVRGYGAACHAALQELREEIEVIVFMNADLTDDPTLLQTMTTPILRDECDLTIGARVASLREAGSMSLPQRFGDKLATHLIYLVWRYRYYDLGPFRAIHRSSLDQINMQDRAFGWTIEMQIRALQEGLRIQQLPVPYRRSPTPSKIGGTIRGVISAGYCILSTWFRLWRSGGSP